MTRFFSAVTLALIALLLCPDDVLGQRGGGRGRGGANRGNRRTQGRNNRNNRPPRNEDGERDAEAERAVTSPVREERLRLRWIELDAEAADPEGTTTAEQLISRVLKTKARERTPTILFLYEVSSKAKRLEERVFEDEQVILASNFVTCVKLPLTLPIKKEQRKALTNGRGAAILVFDANRKEAKRLKGYGTSATSLVSALASPVKKAWGISLKGWIKKEQQLLRDMDAAFVKHREAESERAALAERAATSKSAARKLGEQTREVEKRAAKFELLKAKERDHLESALRR